MFFLEIVYTLVIKFVTLSNMTSAAPSYPFFPFSKQSQHQGERRCGGHVWKGYRDYYVKTRSTDLSLRYFFHTRFIAPLPAILSFL